MSPAAGSQEPPSAGAGADAIPAIWRRPLALAADMILLALVGALVGRVFGPMFATMGPWARLLGLGIALVYFAGSNSRMMTGRTPGKRLFGIQVVGLRGGVVSLGRSLLRAVVLVAPFYVGGLAAAVSVVEVFATLLSFGVGGGLLYLYVFNRPTRRSLHDVVGGTMVVKSDWQGAMPSPRLRGFHLGVLGLWCAIVVIGVVVILPWYVPSERSRELVAIRNRLLTHPEVSEASITTGQSSGPKTSTRWVRAVVTWREAPKSGDAVFRDVAEVVLNAYPPARDVDSLTIVVQHGYDLGIWSSWQRDSRTLPPTEWQAQIRRKFRRSRGSGT